MTARAPAEGTILLGKYRIERVLGDGGMGIVARAHHLQLDEPVAIKFLLPDLLGNGEVVQRFLREAQAAVKLKSEHVARVIDVGTLETGAPYMVMEYLEGEDLAALLRRHGPLPAAVAVDVTLQACDALAEAHALGIVHRDIKPSNLFLTRRRDGSLMVKVLDFGISKAPVTVDAGLTRTQTVMGTPAYMSPEQMRSTRSADARADIWSVGVCLYEALGGRRPFEGEAYSELCLKVAMDPPPPLAVPVPPGLDGVVGACLEKDPERRCQSIAALAAALAPYATDPAQASMIAARCARTLGMAVAARAASSGGAAGMPTMRTPAPFTPAPFTPAPFTPAPFTPPPSSVTGAAAQVVTAPRAPRRGIGYAIAGFFVVGGGIAATVALGGKKSDGAGSAAQATHAPAPPIAPATRPDAGLPDATPPAPPPDAAPPAPPPPDAAPAKPPAAPPHKPHHTTTHAPHAGSDDLFDSRE